MNKSNALVKVPKLKVHVVGHCISDADWINNSEYEPDLLKAQLVVFTGGADISPSIYGEKAHRRTSTSPYRDFEEIAAFETACAHRIPIVGICRGAQLACAMSGGRLIQHQDNPSAKHPILTIDGSEYIMTSCHHQAMYPYELAKDNYKVIGWTEGLSKFHQNGEEEEISDKPFKEVEIAYFPKTKALGIQGHPEWLHPRDKRDAKTLEYCNELVTNLLNKKL